MCGTVKINNIKFHFKVPIKSYKKDNLDVIAKEFPVRKSGNIVTIRHSVCIFIIFVGLKHATVNVTSVKEFTDIPQCIELFVRLFLFDDKKVEIEEHVDNISASGSIEQRFSATLRELEECMKNYNGQVYFNQQSFPGITIKFLEGTIVLFLSGKVNIVGCKTEEAVDKMKSHVEVIRQMSCKN